MTTKSLPGKAHIPELQIVRALAIIGVISVHASAAATITMKESAYFFFYNFINIFMRFGTPTFILLSSFVLFYSYYNRPLDKKLIGSFYKKRLLYIIIPYIVFSAIYFALVRKIYNAPLFTAEALLDFGEKLLMGNVYAHLYFVFISIQFYLLFPIVLWIAKKWKRAAYWFVPIGFALQWAFVLFNLYMIKNYGWGVPNKGSWSLSYFSFFFTGAALGIFYPKLKSWLAVTREHMSGSRIIAWVLLWATWLAVALSHVYIYYNQRAYNTRYPAWLYELLWGFHAIFSALVLIGAAFFIYRHMPAFLSKLLYRIGQYSFGIYLIHLLYLYIYDRYVPTFGNSILEHMSYLGSWLFMLLASWATVAFFGRFVPYSWIFFGQLPKKGQKLDIPTGHASGKSMRLRNTVMLGGLAVVLVASATVVGLWMRANDTSNSSKRQELMPVESVAEVGGEYDVIVAGTDPEGIAAAISASRNGLSVLLVDGRGRDILGGLMTVGGLNTLDLNYSPKKSPLPGKHNFLNKGIFQEWYDQAEGTSVDVNTAANVFNRMVQAEDNIDLLMKVQSMEPLVQEGSEAAVVTGMRIVKEDGTELEVTAPAVIDATQDGDIAAAAGAPFTLGRADIGAPDDQMAVTMVFAMKGVTQEIWDSFEDHPSTGIDAMSAWGFPDAQYYESSNPERVKMRGLNIGRQNDDTILVNAMHIFGIDPLDQDSIQDAIEIGKTEAPRIVEYLKSTFEEFKELEFAYTFDELYVRESRHIIGEYRLTMADLMENRDHWDAIAYGSYDVDIQAASPLDKGYVLFSPEQYGVPFRTLVPQKVDGLLVVGRAASFDSLPHGSARVIPLGMATAEAAGAAAKLAVDNGMTFRELSQSKELIAELRERLTAQGMDLKMNDFQEPYYAKHQAYEGLKAAVSMLLTSGNSDNKAFDLDGKSNPLRIAYSMGRVMKQHPEHFSGDPLAAVKEMSEPEKQPLSIEQAAKTIAYTVDIGQGETLTLDKLVAQGWIQQRTLDAISDTAAITNGEFFMLLRDVLEFYAGVVYE
ncbi:FAD-dependent oxidoreductase [Paenibacillus sp. J5C2022]|uniref:FAD-dependent oxidoreductase n=1 Tax=Paenibacillus sp. J5C2022 TaxID=2977129 RepID=UPI00293E6C1B|nr:FAD-dependent oxidoreductase [Paenibacillus sp. J5C2022]